jgi:SAM-dependent methyltransferase
MPPADDLAAVRYARMRWNTPLSEEHATLLLDRLDIRPGARVLDLGCGWGELLLRAVAAGGATGSAATHHSPATGSAATLQSPATGEPSITGIGVDTDEAGLARGRALAADRSLDRRVTFVNGEAAAWREPADRVLCVGASHAFGGTYAALDALADLVPSGGRLLFGDGVWERPPSAEALEIFGTDVVPLADLVEHARVRGWRVLHFSVADQREWDEFEAGSRAGRQEWLLAHPDDPRAAHLREDLDTRLREYVDIYRGVLGLGYFVLAR